jgi:hypothetical protein
MAERSFSSAGARAQSSSAISVAFRSRSCRADGRGWAFCRVGILASRIEGSDRQSRPQGCEQGDAQRTRLPMRAHSDRPRGCRAAEQRDELAPFHSITSSARASTLSGKARPSVLAVWTLIVSSYLIGCCTGNSVTFAPLRIRSTYDAARLYESSTSDA